MTQQKGTLSIVIEPEGPLSHMVGGYFGRAPGPQEPARGDTMAAALQSALEALGRQPHENVAVKIAEWTCFTVEEEEVREPTRVTAEELVGLLRVLRGTYEEGPAYPARCLSLSECDLTAIDLSPEALDVLEVGEECRWEGTRGINLCGIELQGADLIGANLQCALLWDARLQGVNLGRAQLRGARLENAWLEGADLRGADLRELDLRNVKGLTRVRWHNARLEKTWLYRHQIEPIQDELDVAKSDPLAGYREAMEAYLVLKTNFHSLRTYDSAAWAYVKEQQMRKATYFPTTLGKHRIIWNDLTERPRRWWSLPLLPHRVRSLWLHFLLFIGVAPFDDVKVDRLRWARNWFYELLTLYGESPWRPLLCGLITILIFALVFAAAGNVATGDPSLEPAPTHSFLSAVTHSVAAFATIGFNTLEPVGWGARLLTAVESMLGIGFFALLIYTLGNRMSRS